MSGTIHRLTGYDRRTGRLRVEYDIPKAAWGAAKRIARIGPYDDELGSYRLDPRQAHDIANAIAQPIDTEKFDYYVEAFAEPQPKGRSAA
jgi:hypothetical protein